MTGRANSGGTTAGAPLRSHALPPAPGAAAPAGLPASIGVWDLGVRVFHWSLVASTVGALATGFLAPRWWLDFHVVFGTAVAALLVFRIVWGFHGSTYARFASFHVSPPTAIRHAVALVRGRAGHYIGHNPLGAMMILALLAVLGSLVASGVVVLGGALKEGPVAAFVSFQAANSARLLHEWASWGLLGLIGGHLAGVVVESWRTRENLVRGMMSGRKRNPAGAVAMPPREARRLGAGLVVAGLAALLVPATVALSLLPVAGVPTQALDPTYAKECSACHAAHHPSLAPAASWSRMIDGLVDHFGDNAGLEPEPTRHLRDYLAANGAEAFDTKAANLLRVADPGGSLRITETAGWKAIHRHVAPAVFTAKPVDGRLNCAACHADAGTGRFAPRSISLPNERTSP